MRHKYKMGTMSYYICINCGYSFSAAAGAGFTFPHVYAEAKEKMKNGELGEEAKKFFEEHPDGAINCDLVVMQCQKCRKYDCREALTMYVPKEGYKHNIPEGIWSIAMPFTGSDYVSSDEIEDNYVKYEEYSHKCSNCGGEMKIISEDDVKTCPDCGHELEIILTGCWD